MGEDDGPLGLSGDAQETGQLEPVNGNDHGSIRRGQGVKRPFLPDWGARGPATMPSPRGISTLILAHETTIYALSPVHQGHKSPNGAPSRPSSPDRFGRP